MNSQGWALTAVFGVFAACNACNDEPECATVDLTRETRAALSSWNSDWVRFPGQALPPTKIAVPALSHIAEFETGSLRRRAVRALAVFGVEAEHAVPVIRSLLEDSDRQTRCAAACALARLAPDTPGLAAAFLELRLTDFPGEPGEIDRALAMQANWVRWRAQLASIVIDGPARLRHPAFDALSGSLDPDSLSVLRGGVDGADTDGMMLASVLLGSLGFSTRDQPALLAEGLNSSNARVRLASLSALRGLDCRAAVVFSPLLGCLRDSRPDIVAMAAGRLAVLGVRGDLVVPQLIEVVRTGEAYAREAAADALVRFPKHAKQSIPCLLDALVEKETRYIRDGPRREFVIYGRAWAGEALGDLGDAAASALPALRALVESAATNPAIRNIARKAMQRIERDMH